MLLSLLVSSVSWAATPVYTPLPTVPICPGPSGVTCNDVSWVANCGPQFGSISQTDTVNNPCLVVRVRGGLSLADQGRADWSAVNQIGLMTDKVFNRSTDFFVASMPAASTPPLNLTTGATTWADQELAAAADAWKTVINPLYYLRPVATKTGPIDNCESYVYRSFYDVERWVDSVNACKDDSRCKVNVSLNAMTASGSTEPGIARRTFENSEDVAIASGPGNRLDLLRSRGQIRDFEAQPFSDAYKLFSLPKNSFYVGTEQIFTPALINAFSNVSVLKGQQVSDLLDEVSRAGSFYTMGTNAKTNGAWYQDSDGIHQGFSDEWEFHQVMNQRNGALTRGEAREYRKRNAAVIEAFANGTDAMKCLFANAMYVGGCNPKTINAVGKANPGDFKLWESDPFESRVMYAEISPYAFTTPPSLLTQVGLSADQLQQSQVTLSLANNPLQLPGLHTLYAQLPAPSGSDPVLVQVPGMWSEYVPHVDAAADIYKGNLKWMIERTWTINPPRVDTSSANLRLDCRLPSRLPSRFLQPAPLTPDAQFHTDTVWFGVCEMTNVLLNEWNRKLQGKPSCLDRHSTMCDWSPDDFVDRFVTRNLAYGAASKEVEYQYCKRWTGGGKVKDTVVVNNQLLYGLTTNQRTLLTSFRSVLDARETVFKALLASVPLKGTDDFGSTKSDSSKIGGSVFGGGYSYELGWHAQVKKRDANQQICRMGGSAIARFDAQATLFTADFKIVDALATVSSNEADDAKALAQAHLFVVGVEFFDTGDAPLDISGNITPSSLASAGDTSGGEKIRLITLPFQAGPVTITVTAGISYSYSSMLSLVSKVPPLGSCVVGNPIYEVTARFTPAADLGAWADAEASLAGIVGVGLEVELTLVGLSLPLVAEVHIGEDVNKNNLLSIIFNAQLDLVLTTMKGQINLYIEALFMKVASFKLVSWPGYVARFPVFRTPTVALELSKMPPSIKAPN